jgi:hypothetical protein
MASIILPCGCHLAQTHVLEMCVAHAQQLALKEHDERRQRQNYLSGLADLASSQQRRGAEHG